MLNNVDAYLRGVTPQAAGLDAMRLPQAQTAAPAAGGGFMGKYMDRRKAIIDGNPIGAGDLTKKQLWGALARVGAQLAAAGGDPDVSAGEGIARALTAGQNSMGQARQSNREQATKRRKTKLANLDSIYNMLVDERKYDTGRADTRFDQRLSLRGAQTDQAQIESLDRYRQGRLKQDAALTPLEQARMAVYNAQASKYRADAATAGAGGNGASAGMPAFPAGWEWRVGPDLAHQRYQDYLDGRKAGRDDLGAPIYQSGTLTPEQFYNANFERVAPPVTGLGALEQISREQLRQAADPATGPHNVPVPMRPNDYSNLWQ